MALRVRGRVTEYGSALCHDYYVAMMMIVTTIVMIVMIVMMRNGKDGRPYGDIHLACVDV